MMSKRRLAMRNKNTAVAASPVSCGRHVCLSCAHHHAPDLHTQRKGVKRRSPEKAENLPDGGRAVAAGARTRGGTASSTRAHGTKQQRLTRASASASTTRARSS